MPQRNCYGPERRPIPRSERNDRLDLHAVWRLHVPEAVAILVLSYMAGNHPHIVRQMV
jgi:hypothetical protein